MTGEQHPPDELVAENELICEKLLGWNRLSAFDDSWPGRPWSHDGNLLATPAFTTWAEAGLILDSLGAKAARMMLYRHDEVCDRWECSYAIPSGAAVFFADTGPLAIRAAALEYVKAVQP